MAKKKTTEMEEAMESGNSHASLGMTDPECGGGVVLRAQNGGTVYADSGRIFATGVSVEIPEGYVGLLASDPKMCRDRGCVCSGVLLPGEGKDIVVKLYNQSRVGHDVQQGDAIGRLVIVPVLPLR